MANVLSIRNKKIIYNGDEPLLPDLFDKIIEFGSFIIAYNSSKVVFLNSSGTILNSVNGKVVQVAGHGKCIAIKNNEEKIGVYLYKGTLVVPFNFCNLFIADPENLRFMVKKISNDEKWQCFEV